MISFSRLALVAVGVVALLWLAPTLLQRATQPERVRAVAAYSAVTGQFHLRIDAFDKTQYQDETGAQQSVEDYRRALPFIYFADLAKHGDFPATVAGQAVTPEQAKREMQVQQFDPQRWNAPRINLNSLLESAPWGTRLSLPDDMFRVEPSGITFLRTVDGSRDDAKSAQFTDALNKAGLVWPVQALGGNPSPLKEFDEGYLLVDARLRLFQMKMAQGKPLVRDLGLTAQGPVRAVIVSEHARREFIGAVVSDDAIQLVTYRGTLVTLPAEGFRADDHTASLRSDPLNYSIAVTDLRDSALRPVVTTVTNRDYQPLRRFEALRPEAYRGRILWQRNLASLLFPVSLVQFTPSEGRVVLRVEPASSPLAAALGCLASALALVVIRRRQRRFAWGEAVVPLITGLPGLICVLAFGPLSPRPARDPS